jgi:formate dehydrogenase assembly factor FdhD
MDDVAENASVEQSLQENHGLMHWYCLRPLPLTFCIRDVGRHGNIDD